jgi:hypothetical protein
MMEHATLADVNDADTLSDEAKLRLADYLLRFLKPIKGEHSIDCPGCGGALYHGGGPLDALCSTFRWGMAHGAGICGRCKWPVRMYHFVKLEGEEERRIVYPLAYRCYTDKTLTVELDPAAEWAKRQAADAEA